MTTEEQKPLFISIREYSYQMGQSAALTRKQIGEGKVCHIRSNDRILIPACEPQRRLEEALASFHGNAA